MPKNANSKIGQSELRPRILDFCSEVVETSEGDRQKGEPELDTKFSISCETSSKIARKKSPLLVLDLSSLFLFMFPSLPTASHFCFADGKAKCRKRCPIRDQ